MPEQREPDRIVATVDACIHCGARYDLRDEHIVPYAFDGNLKIKNGSCGACAAITARIEERVLRDTMLSVRTSLGIRARRPKSRPSTLPVIRRRDDEDDEIVEVAVADHPTMVALPLFGWPAIIRNDGNRRITLDPRRFWYAPVGQVTLQQAVGRIGHCHSSVSLSAHLFGDSVTGGVRRVIGPRRHG